MTLTPERDLPEEQSRHVAARIREELARRRMSRQRLAADAKISLSTLEKALSERRPFTLATTIRLEEALGLSLRTGFSAPANAPAPKGSLIAPEEVGSYSRQAVSWIEGMYLTLRPSFGGGEAIYAYRTEIGWDEERSHLTFREAERVDAAFTQDGAVSIPNLSGHIYLVTNKFGQYRLITVSRPNISGEMYGILTTLLVGRGAQLTPIAAPIVLVPIRHISDPDFGRISSGDRYYERYRGYLKRAVDEPYALFASFQDGGEEIPMALER